MSNIKRILYLQPFEFFGDIDFLTESFLRISNYLNSKKSELEGDIEEEYLDLRVENLPKYYPENVEEYRIALKHLLSDVYRRFPFDIVAISCYASFAYLNSVEIAWMIKQFINPSSYIIVGGFHPSVKPEDFYSENIPSYFTKYYQENATPFDYIAIDEGEIPFFRFVRDSLNETIKTRKDLREPPIILEREIVKNLDDLPIIDLTLFKKYKDFINKKGAFHISFNRGCQFQCKFCPSKKYMTSYKTVRSKSIEKCVAELKSIVHSDWLNLKRLKINDVIFFPKKSQREQFLNELEKFYNKYNVIPFEIYIFDRMELCTSKFLEDCKKLNIIVGFGLETGSPTLLCKLGKFIGKNNNIQRAAEYLEKAEKLIIKANKIDVPIIFLYMGAVPGSTEKITEEISEFFFGKRFSGRSLIEKYKINLQINKFALLPGNMFYDKGEEMLGATYYFNQSWKIFDKDQAFYSGLIKPSKHFSFPEVINYFIDFLGKLYKYQMKLKNNFYNLLKYIIHRKACLVLLKIYEEKIEEEERFQFVPKKNFSKGTLE